MAVHHLGASQLVPAPIGEVFAFFAEPDNLARLTPPGMRFEFLTEDRQMREGLVIDYRLRPLLGMPVRWQTLVDRYDPPGAFHDVQARGPYRAWRHTHRFEAVKGGTLVRDEVEYALPLGLLGEIAHRLTVRSRLAEIFHFRARAIESIFEPPAAPTGLTVAVAGGTGFVGGGIARELRRRGHRVVVVSHRGEAGRGSLPDDVELRTADVADTKSLSAALTGADALVI